MTNEIVQSLAIETPFLRLISSLPHAELTTRRKWNEWFKQVSSWVLSSKKFPNARRLMVFLPRVRTGERGEARRVEHFSEWESCSLFQVLSSSQPLTEVSYQSTLHTHQTDQMDWVRHMIWLAVLYRNHWITVDGLNVCEMYNVFSNDDHEFDIW